MEEFFEVKKVFSHNKTERGLAFHCIASTQLKDFKVVTNSGKTNNLVIEVNLINTNVVQLRMIPWDFYYKKQSDIVKATNVPSFFVREDSIIPMGPEISYVGEKRLDLLTLDIYLQEKAEFTLYDDGEVVDFKDFVL